jgi:hypothetical protein
MTLEFALLVIVNDDARALLPAMLEGIESEKGYFCRVRMTEYGEDAALILWTVLKNGACRRRVVHARAIYTPSVKKEKGFAFILS